MENGKLRKGTDGSFFRGFILILTLQIPFSIFDSPFSVFHSPLSAQSPSRPRLPALPKSTVQVITDWRYPRYDDQDRLEMEAHGDEARLLGTDRLELTNPSFALYRAPGPDGRTVVTSLTASGGDYDLAGQVARLTGNVVVEQEDGTRIETDELVLRLDAAPPGDGAPAGPRRKVRQIAAAGAVRVSRPGLDPEKPALAVTGSGLAAEDNGSAPWLEVARDIRATITDEFERRYLRARPPVPGGPPPVPASTHITCRGPFRLDRLPADDRPTLGTERFRFAHSVDFLRTDTQGTTAFLADRVDLHVVSEGRSLAAGPGAGGGGAVDAIRVQAEGNVRFRHEDPPPATGEAVPAADRTSLVEGNRLLWTYQDDTVILWGAPQATCRRGTTGMTSETVTVGRISATIDCEGKVEATFYPEAATDGRPRAAAAPPERWEIACGRLELGYAAAARAPSTLNATEDVRIRSESAPAGPGPAGPARPERLIRAGEMKWDAAAGRARLTGAPWVALDEPDLGIRAHRVLLDPDRDRILLRGPKQVMAKMKKPPPPPAAGALPPAVPPAAPANAVMEEIRITCAGDLLWDSSARKVYLNDEAVLTKGTDRVQADRMTARLGEGGKGVESVQGFGGVVLDQSGADPAAVPTRLAGDWFLWDPGATFDLDVRGCPTAALQQGAKFLLRSERIQYNSASGRLKAANPTQRGRAVMRSGDPAKSQPPSTPNSPKQAK